LPAAGDGVHHHNTGESPRRLPPPIPTVREFAQVEKGKESYISRVLRLTLLAPDMVEAILDGRQPEGLTLSALMEGVAVEWPVPR
jgi:hypothetical protein